MGRRAARRRDVAARARAARQAARGGDAALRGRPQPPRGGRGARRLGGGRAALRARGAQEAATGADRMTELMPPTFDPADAAAAAARFAAAAPADVAYALVDSPVGRLVVARTEHGLVRIAYEDFNGGLDPVLDALAQRLSPRILE